LISESVVKATWRRTLTLWLQIPTPSEIILKPKAFWRSRKKVTPNVSHLVFIFNI
jgi:hypothetical protein